MSNLDEWLVADVRPGDHQAVSDLCQLREAACPGGRRGANRLLDTDLSVSKNLGKAYFRHRRTRSAVGREPGDCRAVRSQER